MSANFTAKDSPADANSSSVSHITARRTAACPCCSGACSASTASASNRVTRINTLTSEVERSLFSAALPKSTIERSVSPSAAVAVSTNVLRTCDTLAGRSAMFVMLPRMAETVEFRSNGSTASGYLARPASGSGPGVLVIQEWWGLDSGIKTMTDRLAGGGFVALAPDLYHGELAGHTEMDKASKLMQTMPPDRAARDMSGAVDFLAGHPAVTSNGIGVVGFCMGGMLAWIIGASRSDKVKAIVPFYGYPQGGMEPDWSKLAAPVSGHMAERDDFFGPDGARALEAKLRGMGKNVTLKIHPGTGHAFMG